MPQLQRPPFLLAPQHAMQPVPESPKKKSQATGWFVLAVVAVVLLAILIGVTNLAIITGVVNQGKRSNTTTAPQAPRAPTQQSQTTTVPRPTPRIGGSISDFYSRADRQCRS